MAKLIAINVLSAGIRCKHMIVHIFSSKVIQKSFQKNRKILWADNLSTTYTQNNCHNNVKDVWNTPVFFPKVLIPEKEYCISAHAECSENQLTLFNEFYYHFLMTD